MTKEQDGRDVGQDGGEWEQECPEPVEELAGLAADDGRVAMRDRHSGGRNLRLRESVDDSWGSKWT